MGNTNLKASGVEIEYTKDEIREYIKCSKDVVYFAKKYVKIIHVDHGVVAFDLWDFQKEMLRTFSENRFTICKLPRQVGKTTVAAAYLVHEALFKDHQNIAVLAHKQIQATEIIARAQHMYEHLPFWLQQGVVEWNKMSIKLENGSRMFASSTSASAIRGQSCTHVLLDELAHVLNNVQEEFFTSVFPVISSGKTTKQIITSTPKGMDMFYKIWTDSEQGRNDFARVEAHWSLVPGRDEAWKEETIRNTSERHFKQEFECNFLGSTNTLIDSMKLSTMTYVQPLY